MGGEVDELEEDLGWTISCLEGVMDVEEGKLEEELFDKPGTAIGTKFSVLALYPNTVIDEMWLFTVDPLVWVSVFIDKTAGVSSRIFIVKNISNLT